VDIENCPCDGCNGMLEPEAVWVGEWGPEIIMTLPEEVDNCE
jgi:hypothetical protein